jgi:hypothetical protein
MKSRQGLVGFLMMVTLTPAIHALTPPSASDGPIKLLACVVTPARVLEAQVDNQSDDAMFCNIRCNYELGGNMFSHTFGETIPKRFQGRIGAFDTSNARPGNYSGEVGSCKKVSHESPRSAP